MNMKSLYEIENLYKELLSSSKCSNDSLFKNTEKNTIKGWVETIDMVIDSLKMYGEKITKLVMLQYKSYLEDRQNRDIKDHGKDITLGWIKGSIDAIEWLFHTEYSK